MKLLIYDVRYIPELGGTGLSGYFRVFHRFLSEADAKGRSEPDMGGPLCWCYARSRGLEFRGS